MDIQQAATMKLLPGNTLMNLIEQRPGLAYFGLLTLTLILLLSGPGDYDLQRITNLASPVWQLKCSSAMITYCLY